MNDTQQTMTDEKPSDAYLQKLFGEFDANDDDRIDRSEFRRILNVLGEVPSEDVLALEFELIDANGDGLVDFSEFRKWWLDYK